MDITPAARQGLLTDAKTEAMKAKEDESESEFSCLFACCSFLLSSVILSDQSLLPHNSHSLPHSPHLSAPDAQTDV